MKLGGVVDMVLYGKALDKAHCVDCIAAGVERAAGAFCACAGNCRGGWDGWRRVGGARGSDGAGGGGDWFGVGNQEAAGLAVSRLC
jgi:hypothetical protein